MSLTMTATRRPSRLCSAWLSNVVLPAPRKPESTVTGRRRSFNSISPRARDAVGPSIASASARQARGSAWGGSRLEGRFHSRRTARRYSRPATRERPFLVVRDAPNGGDGQVDGTRGDGGFRAVGIMSGVQIGSWTVSDGSQTGRNWKRLRKTPPLPRRSVLEAETPQHEAVARLAAPACSSSILFLLRAAVACGSPLRAGGCLPDARCPGPSSSTAGPAVFAPCVGGRRRSGSQPCSAPGQQGAEPGGRHSLPTHQPQRERAALLARNRQAGDQARQQHAGQVDGRQQLDGAEACGDAPAPRAAGCRPCARSPGPPPGPPPRAIERRPSPARRRPTRLAARPANATGKPRP